MKRKLFAVLIWLLIVCMLLPAAGAEGLRITTNDGAEIEPGKVYTVHEHSWQPAQTIPATCTEKGLILYSCSCGQTKEEEVPAKGHSWSDWKVTRQATCKEEVKRVRKCTGCGEIVESGVIAKTEHTEGEWVVTKEATEDKTGVKELHCSVCDAVLKTEKIPKLAHVHTANGKWEITKEPTCTKEGQRIQRCVKDNTIVLKEAVPPTGHQWSITEEAATCTQDGTRTKTCTVCGAKETETIPASGHQWSVTEDAATCTEDGSRTKTCTVCGVTETETIPASGHAPTTTRTNETAPTCTEDGSHDNVTTCSVCGLELSRETVIDPAVGHSWGETDAEGYRHCSSCGASEYVGVPVPDEPDEPDGE